MHVAIATCANLPEVDPDQDLLLDALAKRGVDARLHAWDDEPGPLSQARLCVIRSTWNYYHALERFLAWAERAAEQTRLLNPLSVVRWNVHKGYLRDLQSRRIAVVPTQWIGRGDGASLEAAMHALGARKVVVKPAVSAASFDTMRVDAANLREGEEHLRRVVARVDAMVQPYVESVEGYGERSLIWIDGEFTHAIRKSPRFGGEREHVSGALPIEADERAFGERVIAAVGQELLYARVDIARDEDGRPQVMEVELLEPSLFLRQSPAALGRFADAIVRRARE